MDRLVETIAHAGVLPSAHIELADVAITSGEDKSLKGFYFAARSLVPDLRHVSSIIISSALKKEWGCVPWNTETREGSVSLHWSVFESYLTRSTVCRNGRCLAVRRPAGRWPHEKNLQFAHFG